MIAKKLDLARWREVANTSIVRGQFSVVLFCFLTRERMIARKLDLARWREVTNTSWSLLAFANFCSSSFSSRCNVRISATSSGCLSFSLQVLTSLQFFLLLPDV